MMIKIIHNSGNRKINSFLKLSRLDYISLERFRQISEGTEETAIERSKEFNNLLLALWIDGTNKATFLGRLKTLDDWFLSVIPIQLDQSISILDVGGSDGSTTFELVKYLNEKRGLNIKAYILDNQSRLKCFRKRNIKFYLTNGNDPFLLQIGHLGILLEESKSNKGIIFNPLIRLLKKILKRLRFHVYLNNQGDILLRSPIVKNSLNIHWIEQDLFLFDEKLVGSFNFIRCCNILNYSYYTEAQLSKAIKLLVQYLKPNGFFLVARSLMNSHDPLHNASLWVKTKDGLTHVSDLNGGSEIKKLVSDFTKEDNRND